MKYSKKVREEAALICAIAASTPFASYVEIRQITGIGSDRSVELANSAWKFVANAPCFWSVLSPLIDAEAESLIRCGWTP